MFRIGIKKTAAVTFTPGVDPLTKLEQFAHKQGGIWGAPRRHRTRHPRMIETAESLSLLITPGKSATFRMTFDEFWLDVLVEYEGKALATQATVPSHDELLADETQLTRLAPS